ncbi:hypothetical protein HUG10_16715 [Halorarum halophilum]|uniref:PRC-barrel domain-containing protein n=1 Tax=Halorarum halophilum TaxID=2743090 RepID=A0A7D5GGF6_9EURY|nr:hypothetical protein [Halobaculum halophilum]QLG29068.1 hypothetical protein HUG10_16715 [Halobaculum halophilum]
MEHFTEEHVGMEVVDQRGEPIGRITGIEEDSARLAPETGTESQMGAAADSGTDALDVRPEQVEVVTDEFVRVSLGDDA